MQVGSKARRIKVAYTGLTNPPDGVLKGLVRFGEVPLEAHSIDVPTFSRIIKIASGITQMPEVTMSYEVQGNDTNTLEFLRDWWQTKDQKQMTIYSVDATGATYDTITWDSVEIRRYSEPEADLANPTYARVDITVLPNDITFVGASMGSATDSPNNG